MPGKGHIDRKGTLLPHAEKKATSTDKKSQLCSKIQKYLAKMAEF